MSELDVIIIHIRAKQAAGGDRRAWTADAAAGGAAADRDRRARREAQRRQAPSVGVRCLDHMLRR
jgi:hypothetical protein